MRLTVPLATRLPALALVFLTGCDTGIVDTYQEWKAEYPSLDAWLIGCSAVMFVFSIVAIPFLVAAIPEDYFADSEPPRLDWQERHPAWRWTVLVARNLMGAALIVIGIILIPLPGQGILVMLVGLGMTTFPGKRRMELWIVRRPSIAKALQWVRQKSGHPPLNLPELRDPDHSSSDAA